MTLPVDRPRDPWPTSVFDAPVFRGLDARALRDVEGAGRLLSVAGGAEVYRAGSSGESFFVVASGSVVLSAIRRGDDRETELRTATAGASFGEESTVGLARRATAVATEQTTIAEIPVHVFRRAAARSGKAEVAERLLRALRRAATRDLLSTLAFTRTLSAGEIDVLLDAATHHRVARGEAVYRQGDPAEELWLVADGLVQIQTDDGDRLHVRAYLGRGDFFGDAEIESGGTRRASAVASGPSALLSLPARVVKKLSGDHVGLLAGMRRVAEDQLAEQRQIVGRAAQNATQHAFRDLYRLQVARSLLVIDLESCVRCGHCAWACADLYGEARLVRRGDKMIARVEAPHRHGAPDGAPKHLLLPNSCQHCENPACMVDCPTGSIGRDPEGEVFIRPELCTGCGACAKACPWDNIQMAPRGEGVARPAGESEYAEIAVKCDLCRAFEAPACVQACPTESIFRMNPAEEIADVRELLRGGATEGARPIAATDGRALVAGSALAAVALASVGGVMHARALWTSRAGLGLGAGALAALGMIALLAYAWPKRRVRSWMRPRRGGARDAHAPSVVRPQLRVHTAIGVLTLGFALAHAPVPPSGRSALAGALMTLLLATSVAGALTALAYRFVPKRLARLERSAALPEDFPLLAGELKNRLYREVSGKSDLVKRIFEKVLLPYAKSPLGPLALATSGRTLREEEAALRARIDRLLEGRGADRLAGLSDLVRVVVEIRSLPAQRFLVRLLRVGLPIHIVTFGAAMAMLVLHVVFAMSAAR
jgi:Fe-S-cluster-containing dehydrogenase component/CRP-like cAMP-binding protein